ncbi:dihydroorotase [bacterium]|nr:dihydroorotase [bacterium]
MKTLIRGAVVIDPSQNLNAKKNILIKDSIVEAILDPQETVSSLDQSIDLDEKCFVAPGLVDMHVHFRDPGQVHKEDLKSGSLAAVAGGYTSVMCMPNTYPPNDNVETTRYIVEKAKKEAVCHVYPVGAISKSLMGEKMAPLEELKAAGCVAFSDDGRPCKETQVFKAAMQLAAQLNVPVIEHCEDLELSKGKTTISNGEVAKKLGLEGLDSDVETMDVLRSITLASETGCHLHLAHLSCKESIEILRKIKPKMTNISAEVCPHHLFLTTQSILQYESNAKMYPPLRHDADNVVLQAALAEGLIDVIATDHAPHTEDEKGHEFCSAPNGILGLQTALASSLQMVDEGKMSLFSLIERMSTQPAQLAHLNAGTLRPGSKADLCVFMQKKGEKLSQDHNFSKSSNSPLWDIDLYGKVLMTFVEGKIVYGEY